MARYLRPTGPADRSRWRRRSNQVIQQVFAENPELVADPTRYKDLRKLVSAAYPFGTREHWPYKAWCSAVRDAFYKLSTVGTNLHAPLYRRCGACGAKPGMPCKGLTWGDPVYEHDMVIQDAITDGRSEEDIAAMRAMRPLHESRTPPQPTMPLFAGLEVA